MCPIILVLLSRCLHSLSRSVQQLRTSFHDHAVWKPLMKVSSIWMKLVLVSTYGKVGGDIVFGYHISYILWVFEQLMCAHLGGTAANCSISPHLGTWCFGESASPFARLFSSGHPPQAHNSTSLYHSHATGCHNHQHYATSMGLIYKSGHGTSSAPRGKHEAVCYRQAYLSL